MGLSDFLAITNKVRIRQASFDGAWLNALLAQPHSINNHGADGAVLSALIRYCSSYY
jgi:hypothetical protein